MLANLTRAYMEANRHIRDEREVPKTLELSIDCSDPYLRQDTDADGHGSAPPEDEASDRDGNEAVGKIPLRRSTVFVSREDLMERQGTIVLSAAVSSSERIERDCEAARVIGKRMDIERDIPNKCRLEVLLETLFPESSRDGYDGKEKRWIEDRLDISIAYLRRVHLFTFYNGCTSSDSAGDVFSGIHASGSIHLRLRGADEILQKTKEDTANIYGDLNEANDKNTSMDGVDEEASGNRGGDSSQPSEAKDMLVMRLDESIAKVVETPSSNMEFASPFVVNEAVDALASEIESMEEKTKKEWIDKHAVIDNDGRARCSFHFCRKLFKDKSFLQKHLLKKHGEYLRAECAKCHDTHMMSWWDGEEYRPVPQVLVDCGPRFGKILSSVSGATSPSAPDPEPDLWREQQERIRQQEEEEERYREQQVVVAEQAEADRQRKNETRIDGESGNNDFGNKGGFVDVDDMKDEKVQLSFDNVDVVAIPSKKKKKKKKKRLL